jgi:hypoxanthine phosphoribosyltransferase
VTADHARYLTKADIEVLVTKAALEGWNGAVTLIADKVADTGKTLELQVIAAGGTASDTAAAYLRGLLTATEGIEQMVRTLA